LPRALFIVEDDVDDIEFLYSYYRLKEEGIEPVVAIHTKYSEYLIMGKNGRPVPAPRKVKGKRGIEIEVDIDYKEALDQSWDVLVLPGGRGPDRARQHPEAVEIVRRLVTSGVPTLAICHGPQLLISAGVVRGRRVTGYWGIKDDLVNAGAVYVDENVVVDGNIVTVRHTRFLAEGLREFVKLLKSLKVITA
jgi:protease I